MLLMGFRSSKARKSRQIWYSLHKSKVPRKQLEFISVPCTTCQSGSLALMFILTDNVSPHLSFSSGPKWEKSKRSASEQVGFLNSWEVARVTEKFRWRIISCLEAFYELIDQINDFWHQLIIFYFLAHYVLMFDWNEFISGCSQKIKSFIEICFKGSF